MFWLATPVALILGASAAAPPALVALSPVQIARAQDPDRLYADRENLESALAAASIWEARLAGDAKDFEAAWKLSRACYWLSTHVPAAERRGQFGRGIEAGRRAIAIADGRPEGHFWMAANMGAMAESFGLRVGLKYRAPVKRELERVLAIDPSFQEGSADRALGRWYLRVPALFGGSKTKSVEHLRRSLTYAPGDAASHSFLADTYLAMDRVDDARLELQRVLDAPPAGEWAPEIREFQEKARAALAKIAGSRR